MAGLTEGLQKVEGRAQRTGGSEQKGSEMGEVRKAEFLEAAAVCFPPPPRRRFLVPQTSPESNNSSNKPGLSAWSCVKCFNDIILFHPGR